MIKLINNLFSFLFLSLVGNCFFFSNEPWRIGFQVPATPLMEGISNFHNYIMFFLIGIGVFVLWLLARCLYLYNAKTNKNPIDNFTHATTVEIVWTIVPAFLLLIVLFYPSMFDNYTECSGGSGNSGLPKEDLPRVSNEQVQRDLADAEASRARSIERLERDRYQALAESRIKASSDSRINSSEGPLNGNAASEISVQRRSDATNTLVNAAADAAQGGVAGALSVKASGGSNKAAVTATGIGMLGGILGSELARQIRKNGE